MSPTDHGLLFSGRSALLAGSVVAVAFLVLLPVSPPAWLVQYPLAADVSENLAHPAVFFLAARLMLALLASSRLARSGSNWSIYATTLFVVAAMGASTELIQGQIGRDATLEDLVNDMLGGGLATLMHSRNAARGRRGGRWLPVGIALTCALLVAPPIQAAVAYVARAEGLPLVWKARSALYGAFGGANQNHDYPGVEIWEPWPDWRGYSAMRILVSSTTATETTLNISVYDQDYRGGVRDRFSEDVAIPADAACAITISTARIQNTASGRVMNLGKVVRILIVQQRADAERAPISVESVSLVPNVRSAEIGAATCDSRVPAH